MGHPPRWMDGWGALFTLSLSLTGFPHKPTLSQGLRADGLFQGRAVEGEAERRRKAARGTLPDRLEPRAAGAQACRDPGGDGAEHGLRVIPRRRLPSGHFQQAARATANLLRTVGHPGRGQERRESGAAVTLPVPPFLPGTQRCCPEFQQPYWAKRQATMEATG